MADASALLDQSYGDPRWLDAQDFPRQPVGPIDPWALPPQAQRASGYLEPKPRPSDQFLPDERMVGRSAGHTREAISSGHYGQALLDALELVAAMAPIPGAKRGKRGPKGSERGASEGSGTGAEAGRIPDRGSLPGGNLELPASGGAFHPYTPVPGQPATAKIPGHGEVEVRPIPQIEAAARAVAERQGRDYEVPAAMPPYDPERAKRIANAFDIMQHNPHDPRVKSAYEAMIEETLAQYKALKDQGFTFHFNEPGQDPYKLSPALGYLDMRDNGRLSVFPTLEGFGSGVKLSKEEIANNPLLRPSGEKFGDREALANDLFRVVHDAYGHNGPGNPFFRAPGEERAWGHHSLMYGADALPAMTSETRGQNSWVNSGPFAEQNKGASGADTIYSDQKIGLMPEWTWLEGRPQRKKP